MGGDQEAQGRSIAHIAMANSSITTASFRAGASRSEEAINRTKAFPSGNQKQNSKLNPINHPHEKNMSNDSQQRTTHVPIPRGRHPFLKVDGKPIVFLPRTDPAGANPAWEAVLDSSNFKLDGRLGSVLRSSEFVHFLAPLFASEDACGRTTPEIWRWAATKLGLFRWKNMATADLDWFEDVLHELGFLSRYGSAEDCRWFYDGF